MYIHQQQASQKEAIQAQVAASKPKFPPTPAIPQLSLRSISPIPSSHGDEAKAKGNAAFSSGDFNAAVTHFTEAIDLAPSSHVFYSTDTATVETSEVADAFYKETFPLKRTEVVEGQMIVKLDKGEDAKNWVLTVGCNLPGKWVLHWGVNYMDDVGNEWDQPPSEMRPAGSVSIKDYAIETPLKESLSPVGGDTSHEVKIDVTPNNTIAAINFVLKDEETGA